MALSQTVEDPIEGGILTQPEWTASFMHSIEMNTKWEYVLDPHLDTHDDVRQRSRLLFSTVLYCGALVPKSDPVLLCRLCSLARSLALKSFAESGRSMETIQALCLLVFWKDVDDNVSYLDSDYAFRALSDLDLGLDRSDDHWCQAARYMRTWLALSGQDKQ